VHQNASRVRVACARKHIEEGQPRINPVKKPPSRKQYAFMSNFFDALLSLTFTPIQIHFGLTSENKRLESGIAGP
jgi:hypothetical protein